MTRCDNITFFLLFPLYSDDLRSPQSLRSLSLLPVTRASYYGLFPCDDHSYVMSPNVCTIPARCWTYSYSVDPPPPCALH